MSGRLRQRALLDLINTCLRQGAAVEIDGFGRFNLEDDNVIFEPSRRPRVFLAYGKEDRAKVKRLSRELKGAGFEPWMDEEQLLPGQNWPRAIERAIEISDFFVICFSSHSVAKRGFFQSELRYALDIASCVPLDEIFLVPVRLGDCELPLRIARSTQYLDLFPDWETGVKALILMIRGQTQNREKKRPGK